MVITSDTVSKGSDLSTHCSITWVSLELFFYIDLPPPPQHTQVFNFALNGNILVGNAVIMD